MSIKKKIKRTPIKQSQRPKPPVHVGHLVWWHLNKVRIPRSLLAKETNRSLTTVSRQLRKSSMQVAELFEFCHVVKYNFFEELAARLPAEYSAAATQAADKNAAMEEEINRLLQENEALKKENIKLNERVDMLITKI